jgi:hypothetical protein
MFNIRLIGFLRRKCRQKKLNSIFEVITFEFINIILKDVLENFKMLFVTFSRKKTHLLWKILFIKNVEKEDKNNKFFLAFLRKKKFIKKKRLKLI